MNTRMLGTNSLKTYWPRPSYQPHTSSPIPVSHKQTTNYKQHNTEVHGTGSVRPKMSMYEGARSIDWLPTRTRTPTITLLGLVLFTSKLNPPACHKHIATCRTNINPEWQIYQITTTWHSSLKMYENLASTTSKWVNKRYRRIRADAIIDMQLILR